MKICCDCNALKNHSEYYKLPKGKRAGVCKECHKLRMKIRRLTNPYVQEYDRARAKTPERKAAAAEVLRAWRKKHPEAHKAQCAVNNALQAGKIRNKPCEICGTAKHVHAHHQDYSKPLDVKWLCAKCHHRIHATFPELGGNHQRNAA